MSINNNRLGTDCWSRFVFLAVCDAMTIRMKIGLRKKERNLFIQWARSFLKHQPKIRIVSAGFERKRRSPPTEESRRNYRLFIGTIQSNFRSTVHERESTEQFASELRFEFATSVLERTMFARGIILAIIARVLIQFAAELKQLVTSYPACFEAVCRQRSRKFGDPWLNRFWDIRLTSRLRRHVDVVSL